MSTLRVDNKRLISHKKREQQKYLILLTNQIVIIDNEWAALKQARRLGKIADMLPTDGRVNKGITGLTKLLESFNKE